jgi:hypothetical protein
MARGGHGLWLSLQLVNEQRIAPHVPVIDKSKREDGTFRREDFTPVREVL